jgi:hypothetical protein
VTDGKKMEGSCSTGQSPQRAVVPVEEEEEEEEEEETLLISPLDTKHHCILRTKFNFLRHTKFSALSLERLIGYYFIQK